MLPFRLFHNKGELDLPLSLYSCGLHPQHIIHRPIGYPTFQCMICFSGSGTFHFEGIPYLKMKKERESRGVSCYPPTRMVCMQGKWLSRQWMNYDLMS